MFNFPWQTKLTSLLHNKNVCSSFGEMNYIKVNFTTHPDRYKSCLYEDPDFYSIGKLLWVRFYCFFGHYDDLSKKEAFHPCPTPYKLHTRYHHN